MIKDMIYLEQYGMYHIVVDVTEGNVKTGDIAHLEINPLYISKDIEREYRWILNNEQWIVKSTKFAKANFDEREI